MASLLKAFEDTSIFEGVVCFIDDDGVDYRFEYNPGGGWKGFVLEGDAYIFQSQFRGHKNATIMTLYYNFLRASNGISGIGCRLAS